VASKKPCNNLKLKVVTGPPPKIVILLMLDQNSHLAAYTLFAERESIFKRIMPGALVVKPYEKDKLRNILSGGKADAVEAKAAISSSRPDDPRSANSATTSEAKCDSQVSETETGPSMRLFIISPEAGAWVDWEAHAEGVGACSRSVWFVMHPVGDATYYVQQKAEVREHGSFVGTVVLGHGGDDVDCGAVFELRAFESPTDRLYIGKKLSSWPDAEVASISVPLRRSCAKDGL